MISHHNFRHPFVNQNTARADDQAGRRRSSTVGRHARIVLRYSVSMSNGSIAHQTVEQISQAIKGNMAFFKDRKVKSRPGERELSLFRSFMWDATVVGFGGFAWWLFIVELQNIRKQLLERPQWMGWRVPKTPISRCVLAGLFAGSCYTVLGLETIFNRMLTEDAGITAEIYCSAVKNFEGCLQDPTCRAQAGLSHDSMARTNTGKSAPKMLPHYAEMYLACAKGAYGTRNGWKAPEDLADASGRVSRKAFRIGNAADAGSMDTGAKSLDENLQDPWAQPPERRV